jgi:hypothetical protein
MSTDGRHDRHRSSVASQVKDHARDMEPHKPAGALRLWMPKPCYIMRAASIHVQRGNQLIGHLCA